MAQYDGFSPEDILTAEGMESLAAFQALKGYNSALFQLPAGPNIIKHGWQENVTVKNYLNHAASGRMKINGPLLVIQTKMTQWWIWEQQTNAVQETATMLPIAKIQYDILLNVTHASAMYAGQSIWMDWIAARFADESIEDEYRSIPWFGQLQRSEGRPIGTSRLRPNADRFCSLI